MIAVDTNILARFYVNDPNDPEAAKQRPIAHRIMVKSSHLYVPLTVLLELEWVLRAFYRFKAEDFISVGRHLAGLGNVKIEDWPRFTDALTLHSQGLDFADALHVLACSQCTELLSFDDRRFARRATRLQTIPPVRVPE